MTGKQVRQAAVLALLSLGAAGCTGMFEPPKPEPAAQMPLLENRIVALVSAQRAKTDPKAHILVVDPALMTIAKKRSAEMAKNNTFSSGDDPHVSATMLMAEDAKFQGLVGENVAAQHFSAKDGIDVEAFAKRFVEGWAASKPHLENLSFAEYDRTGVGASVNADTVYVAQIFTSDLGLSEKPASAPDVQTVPLPKQGDAQPKGPALRGAIGAGPTQ